MQTEQKLLSNKIICTETECEMKKRMTITSFRKPSFYQRQCIFVTTQERQDELETCTFVMHHDEDALCLSVSSSEPETKRLQLIAPLGPHPHYVALSHLCLCFQVMSTPCPRPFSASESQSAPG